jgi:hypothetical protein
MAKIARIWRNLSRRDFAKSDRPGGLLTVIAQATVQGYMDAVWMLAIICFVMCRWF